MTTAPDHITSTAPKRIYLDLGDCAHLIKPEETFATYAQGEITWSAGNDSGVGIPYVRADLASPTSPASGDLPALPEGLYEVLHLAECALADIGDADREPGDDVAWCEARAAQALPAVRGMLKSLAALASREAAPADPVHIPIHLCREATQDDIDAWAARVSEAAALASPQVAPAPKPLDDPRVQQWVSDAVEGAMAFGFMGNNPSPEGHWLARFWNIGRAEAIKAAAPALTTQTPARPSPTPLDTIVEMLLELAVAAQFACDDSEECEGDDGEQVFSMPASAFNRLSEALDKLEALPDDQPDSTMWPAAKARWAMRNVAAPAPVAPTPAQPSEDARDAARYRWLRDKADFVRVKEGSPQVCLTDEFGEIVSLLPSAYPRGSKLDQAIDVYLATLPSEPEGEQS